MSNEFVNEYGILCQYCEERFAEFFIERHESVCFRKWVKTKLEEILSKLKDFGQVG